MGGALRTGISSILYRTVEVSQQAPVYGRDVQYELTREVSDNGEEQGHRHYRSRSEGENDEDDTSNGTCPKSSHRA